MSIKSFKIELVDIFIALFIGVLGISLINSLSWLVSSRFIVASFYWVRLILYLSLFRVIKDVSEHNTKAIDKIIYIGGVLFALFGLFQLALFPDFSKYVSHGWDPHYYRVLSTFFDPNYAGGFLVLFLLILLSKFYSKLNGKGVISFRLTLAILFVTSIILLTFSRSTYLALVVGVGIFSLLRDKKILIGMILAAVLAFAFVPRVRTRVIGAFKIDATAKLRIEDYKKTLVIIKDNPALGVGFNAMRYAKEDRGYFRDERGVNQPSGHAGAGADNSLLFTWATSGILGLLSILSLFFVIIVEGIRSRYSALILSSTFALLIHSMFVNSLYYTWIIALYMFILGRYLYASKS